MGIRKLAFRGVRWTGGQAVFSVLANYAQLLILTRLLLPKDFAVMALGTAITGMVTQVLGTAAGNTIIQFGSPDPRQWSALYWLHFLLGLAVGALILALRGALASFFGEPMLSPVLVLLSGALVVSAPGLPFRYLLQRELRFRRLFAVQVTVTAGSIVATLLLAYAGYGVYALVWGVVVRSALETILYLWSGLPIQPLHWQMDLKQIRPQLRFSGFQAGERAVDSLISNLDTLLIGRLLGMEALGVYDVVKRVLVRPANLVNNAVEEVTFPIMSREKNQDHLLATIYLNVIRNMSTLLFPVYFFAWLMAAPLITFLLGERWESGWEIFGLVSLIILVRIPRYPNDTLVLAKGKAEWWFYSKVLLLFVLPIPLILGSNLGLAWVCRALLVLHFCLLYPGYRWLIRPLAPVSVQQYAASFGLPLLLTCVSFVSSQGLAKIIGVSGLMQLLISGGLGALIYLILTYCFSRSFLKDSLDFIRL